MKILNLILVSLLFCSCSNDDDNSIEIKKPNENEQQSGKLLSSVKSDQVAKLYTYNNDSSIQSIKEVRNGELRSTSKFIYENGKVSKVIWQDAWEKSEVHRILEYKNKLLVKESIYKNGELIHIDEYYYNKNNRMIKQVQKLEWNNEASKEERTFDIYKVPGRNETHVKCNDKLTFVITYDDKIHPCAKIKGYSSIYISQFYGISNNILSFKRIYQNGGSTVETTDLMFDSSGNNLLELIKKDDSKRVICKDVYAYK